MPESALIQLDQLAAFIDDVEREFDDPELTGILKEIHDLVSTVQSKMEETKDPKLLEKLKNFERDGTITHGVTFEWQNVRMGIRTLVLKVRNYVTWLFGAITKLDDYQEVQIGLTPRPHILIGRHRTGFLEDNMIPAWETTVTDPREALSPNKGMAVQDDNVLAYALRLRAFGKLSDINHLSAAGNTPLDLIKAFRDSLKSAVDQLA